MTVLKETSFKVRAPGSLVVVLKKAARDRGWNLSEQVRYDLMLAHGLITRSSRRTKKAVA